MEEIDLGNRKRVSKAPNAETQQETPCIDAQRFPRWNEYVTQNCNHNELRLLNEQNCSCITPEMCVRVSCPL